MKEVSRNTLLEKYVDHYQQDSDGSVFERFNDALKGHKTGSYHTRRTYNTVVFGFVRDVCTHFLDLPEQYLPIGHQLAVLHALDRADQGRIGVNDGRRLLDQAIEQTEKGGYLVPLSSRKSSSRVKELLGSDFKFQRRNGRFKMQLRATPSEDLPVEIARKDQLLVRHLGVMFDPGPPTDRYCDDGGGYMDQGFWDEFFREDLLGKYLELQRKGDTKNERRRRPNKESTVALKMAALSKFEKHLYRSEKLRAEWILKEMDRPPKRRTPQAVMAESQMQELYRHMSLECRRGVRWEQLLAIRNLAQYSLEGATMIRGGELCNLDWEHFDWDKRQVSIIAGKGKKDRDLRFTRRAANDLERWWDVYDEAAEVFKLRARDVGCAFFTKRGMRMNTRSASRMIDDKAQEAGIRIKAGGKLRELGTHTVRRSTATNCYRNGMGLKELQEVLGHENIAVTGMYLDIPSVEASDVSEQFSPLGDKRMGAGSGGHKKRRVA